MSLRRAALATLILALAGLAISLEIVSLHAQSAGGGKSWCTVNESVNCDVVLSSEYARFAGQPVAWWAVLTYVFCAAAAAVSGWTPRASHRGRAATAVFVVSAWSALFSAYLAVVALVVLRAVCVLCGGLYLVNAGLLVSSWTLFAATRTERRATGLWQARTRWVAAAAAAGVVAFVGAAAWKGSAPGALTAAEIATRHPDFYKHYLGLPVVPVRTDGANSRGGPGDVVIVEFSDFECSHCARAFRILKRTLPRFAGTVQLVFHHFPLDNACNPAVSGSFHRYACLAAMAAECAAAQGRFWEYHDLLFENQSALDRESLIAYAEELGLDRDRFVTCLQSDAPRHAVARDVRVGADLRIVGTPTFFFNGRRVEESLDAQRFEYAIRLEQAARRN
jgi:protein-disulfide isomerase